MSKGSTQLETMGFMHPFMYSMEKEPHSSADPLQADLYTRASVFLIACQAAAFSIAYKDCFYNFVPF